MLAKVFYVIFGEEKLYKYKQFFFNCCEKKNIKNSSIKGRLIYRKKAL
jgi:hypothetical protein